MNILFLNSIPKDVYGGVEHWTGQVSRGLIERGHRICVVGRPDSMFLERVGRVVPDAKLFKVKIGGDFDPLTINRIKGLIEANGIEVVVANFNKDIRLGGLAAKWSGQVGLVWRAGLDLTGTGWVHRALTPKLLDGVITPSQSLKDEIAAHGHIPGDSIHVVRTGLADIVNRPATVDSRRDLREKYSLPQGSTVAVTSGRFVDQKGHKVLVDAAASILKQHDRLYFLLLGDGPLQLELEAQADKLGIRDRFVFAGLLENFDLELLGADLMIHPSLWEPFGIVLVEGMRAGLPIVASRVGGIPEVVAEGETALLIEPDQGELLADAICNLLADPEALRRMGEAGQKRWLECFRDESMVERVESVLSKIVAGKKRHEPA